MGSGIIGGFRSAGFCGADLFAASAWSQRHDMGLPQLDFLTDGQFNEPMYRGSFNMAIIPINLFAAGLE